MLPPEKKDEDQSLLPFGGLEKGIVLQEKNIFHEAPLDAKRCCQLITKICFLLSQGETFTTTEATELFFAVTKLFQSKDLTLRRMVYLILKELCPLSESVIIVISSLTKDINGKVDLFKAHAIRILCKINDSSILSQAERYLKQAIVDKEPYVSSAALVSGIHLMQTPANQDMVRRWFNEVQDAVKSKSVTVQYHALALLYQIKQHDRLAISKLVQVMSKSPIRSPSAYCLLIRYAFRVLEENPSNDQRTALQDFLQTSLRHKSEIVVYEAARAICSLSDAPGPLRTAAISVLEVYLSSPKPVMRFAAVRTLHKIATTHPMAVTSCNLDLESLITDSNRGIATYAITTLLQTGKEYNLDRLMKQISTFMSEIPDEQKIIVVESIRNVCVKFAKKHRSVLNFLSMILRDEGGYEFKKSIVDTILTIIAEIPEAKESGLTHLCEFIEDCEFTALSTKVLYILGRDGPTTKTPSNFIRYIHNRVTLENANVRASAVSALAKFGIHLDSLRPSIIVLLRRCLCDSDDEVRDRAVFYLQVLEEPELAQQYVVQDFDVPLANLEAALLEYQSSLSDTPFDISHVPLATKATKEQPSQKVSKVGPAMMATPDTDTSNAAKEPAKLSVNEQLASYQQALQKIPQFATFGKLFKSSKPIELTESETEYVVTCVKHTFREHFVFQFSCTNTLNDQLLENISVRMEGSGEEEEVKVDSLIPCPSIAYQTTGLTYVVISKGNAFSTVTFSNWLKFTVKEVDPATGEPADADGYEDDYQLEDVELTVNDYIVPTFVSNFQEEWEKLATEAESVEVFNLTTVKTLAEAVKELVDFLGMKAWNRSDEVPEAAAKHILFLSGMYVGNLPVFVRARMRLQPSGGVTIELTVRSSDETVSSTVATAFV